MDPIRCFTCGKVFGKHWPLYRQLCQTKTKEEAFSELGLKRICCKILFLTNAQVLEQVADFNQVHNSINNNPHLNIKKTFVDSSQRVYSTD